jgi:flagellin-like protein
VSNRTVYPIFAAIVLVVIAITIIAASPDEHPIRFGP